MFDVRHFDAWLRVANNLSHYWSAFPGQYLAEFRAVFAQGGWEAVRELCAEFAHENQWSQSFAKFGGILPPPGVDHVHTTSTGRLDISVAKNGDITVAVYRPIGQAKIEIAKFIFDGELKWLFVMSDETWSRLGGAGSALEERHLVAVNEALFGAYVQDYIPDSTSDSTSDFGCDT